MVWSVCQLAAARTFLTTPDHRNPKHEDSKNLEEMTKNPFECGPLLRYDTIENGKWHGAVLIVSKLLLFFRRVPTPTNVGCIRIAVSAQSTDKPTLTYSWDPEQPLTLHGQHIRKDGDTIDSGPSPANPTAQPSHSQIEDKHSLGPNAQVTTAHGQKIYAHGYVPEKPSYLTAKPMHSWSVR